MTDPAHDRVEFVLEHEPWSQIEGLEALLSEVIKTGLARIEDPREGAAVVLLSDDATVHELNRRFRDKDKPTNVLSFPAVEGADNMLGDIALAWGVVEREAADKGISIENHLSHLIVHGFLHLQGYDHQTDAEAEEMEGIIDKENERVRRFFALLDDMEKKVERLARDNRPPFNGERFLTDREFSGTLRISRRCLQDYRDQGRIPYIQLGGKILYRQSDIEKLLEENYHAALV